MAGLRRFPAIPHAAIAALLLAALSPAFAQQAAPPTPPSAQQAVQAPPASPVSTPEDFASAFDAVPCEDADRQAAVRALFERMGAPASAITLDAHEDVENLVVVKPGASAEKIVVGAHYDKVDKGCGAVDNWTGIVALAHLYKTLRNVPMHKTLVFAAFGKEEKGLVGSRAMARAIPEAAVPQYCAMLNIDSLGLAAPQVADDISSRTLEKLAAGQAKDMGIPFAHAAIGRGTSDSASFNDRKIPAITLHGMNRDWTRILHSRDDQPAKVNTASVYLGYRLALSMLVQIDQAPCEAYR